MKKILGSLFVLLCINAHVFGFATIVHAVKGGDEINFSSNTPGVSVFLNNSQIGVINNSFQYVIPTRDGKDKIFTFKKPGYKTETYTVTTDFENLFWLNFVWGGSVGSSVDSLTTNNSRRYTPNQVFVELKKK